MNTVKNFTSHTHGPHTFQRHINRASIHVPRALAMEILIDFVYLFSERPLRDCGHLRHADWRTIADMGTFEQGKALTWISKLREDGQFQDDDAQCGGRQARLLAALEALKADAVGFPDVTVNWEPQAITRRKRGPRH